MKITTEIKTRNLDALSFEELIQHFTRDQLRQLAKNLKVPVGRSRFDTVCNLKSDHRDRLFGTGTMLSYFKIQLIVPKEEHTL